MTRSHQMTVPASLCVKRIKITLHNIDTDLKILCYKFSCFIMTNIFVTWKFFMAITIYQCAEYNEA